MYMTEYLEPIFSSPIYLGSAFGWLNQISHIIGTINQKHYPNLGSDASSVWNFCAHFSDVIWQGNHW